MVLTESPDESGWLQATGRSSGRDQCLQFARRQLRLRMPTKHRVVRRRHRTLNSDFQGLIRPTLTLIEFRLVHLLTTLGPRLQEVFC
ncbi:MAG: hypothetical protein RLZ84_321 [Actinomycetota bacterium]